MKLERILLPNKREIMLYEGNDFSIRKIWHQRYYDSFYKISQDDTVIVLDGGKGIFSLYSVSTGAKTYCTSIFNNGPQMLKGGAQSLSSMNNIFVSDCVVANEDNLYITNKPSPYKIETGICGNIIYNSLSNKSYYSKIDSSKISSFSNYLGSISNPKADLLFIDQPGLELSIIKSEKSSFENISNIIINSYNLEEHKEIIKQLLDSDFHFSKITKAEGALSPFILFFEKSNNRIITEEIIAFNNNSNHEKDLLFDFSKSYLTTDIKTNLDFKWLASGKIISNRNKLYKHDISTNCEAIKLIISTNNNEVTQHLPIPLHDNSEFIEIDLNGIENISVKHNRFHIRHNLLKPEQSGYCNVALYVVNNSKKLSKGYIQHNSINYAIDKWFTKIILPSVSQEKDIVFSIYMEQDSQIGITWKIEPIFQFTSSVESFHVPHIDGPNVISIKDTAEFTSDLSYHIGYITDCINYTWNDDIKERNFSFTPTACGYHSIKLSAETEGDIFEKIKRLYVTQGCNKSISNEIEYKDSIEMEISKDKTYSFIYSDDTKSRSHSNLCLTIYLYASQENDLATFIWEDTPISLQCGENKLEIPLPPSEINLRFSIKAHCNAKLTAFSWETELKSDKIFQHPIVKADMMLPELVQKSDQIIIRKTTSRIYPHDANIGYRWLLNNTVISNEEFVNLHFSKIGTNNVKLQLLINDKVSSEIEKQVLVDLSAPDNILKIDLIEGEKEYEIEQNTILSISPSILPPKWDPQKIVLQITSKSWNDLTGHLLWYGEKYELSGYYSHIEIPFHRTAFVNQEALIHVAYDMNINISAWYK